MKKTLIAASIAALAATSANAAVKLYESETGSFSSYGRIQLELENYDGENQIQNQGSRLGFSGDTKLDNGMTAFTNFEFRFQPGLQNDTEMNVRNSYLGVKGDFGSIKAGNIDSIVYTMVTEQADIMENKGWRSLDEGKNNSRATSIVYETNDLNGFKLAANIKHYASKDAPYGQSLQGHDPDGDGYAPSLMSKDGDEQWNIQLGVSYQLNDELSFALAFDQNNEDGNPGKDTVQPNGDVDPVIAASVNYATDAFGAGLVLENSGDYMVANLTGSVNYGAGDVYALVSFMDNDDDNGVDFGLGVNYKLAKTFHVYGEVAVGNDDVSGIRKLDKPTKGATAVTVGAAYKW